MFLWIFVLASWINVSATKSFSRWTKLIDHEEISPKICSDFFSDSYSPLEFQFYKTPVFITFFIFSDIFFRSILSFNFHDFCSFFCNNLLFSSLFRNLEQIFRHLAFISSFGCFTSSPSVMSCMASVQPLTTSEGAQFNLFYQTMKIMDLNQ